MGTDNLTLKIAAYRCTMNRLSKGKNRIDPSVVRLRQGLDVLLHKYYAELHKQKSAAVETPSVNPFS